MIALADAFRPSAAPAVEALYEVGIEVGIEVVMFTGDNQGFSPRVAAESGIGAAIAEVLPGDTVPKVSTLQRAGNRVAGDGDGV